MSAPIVPGSEPGSYAGGPDGVLVIHGFTGSPASMRPLADAIARAGYAVELPRLPGHGTTIEEMMETGWPDWSRAVAETYEELAGRCRKVAVAGLSMGGTLAVWLAASRPEIAALVAINPAVEPGAAALADMGRDMLAAGTTVIPGIGSDIAKPGVVEPSYDGTPVAPLISMSEAVEEVAAMIPAVRCPTLVFSSTQDHVVPPSSSEYLVAHVTGPVERVVLERSYHVATLDYDAEEIQQRTVDFLAKVLA